MESIAIYGNGSDVGSISNDPSKVIVVRSSYNKVIGNLEQINGLGKELMEKGSRLILLVTNIPPCKKRIKSKYFSIESDLANVL